MNPRENTIHHSKRQQFGFALANLVQKTMEGINTTANAAGRVLKIASDTKTLVIQTVSEATDLTLHLGKEIGNIHADRKMEREDIEAILDSVMQADGYTSITDEQLEILAEAGMPKLYCEMLQGIRAIKDIPRHNKRIANFAERMNTAANDQQHKEAGQRQPRVYITGEGSSVSIPGELGVNIAESLKVKNAQVIKECCGEMLEKDIEILPGDTVIIVSNSGNTDTAVDLAKKATKVGQKEIAVAQKAISNGAIAIAVTKDPESELAKACGTENTIKLNCGSESNVGATKSVVESSFIVSNLIKSFAGEQLDENLDAVAEQYSQALTQDIPQELIRALSMARTFILVGANGIHKELALKTAETIGIPTRLIDRPYLIHGDEESFKPWNAVLLIEPYEKKMGKIKKLIGSRNIPLFCVTHNEKTAESLPKSRALKTENAGLYQEIVNLGLLQNLLIRLAVYKKHNCVPKHSRKVGDAVET